MLTTNKNKKFLNGRASQVFVILFVFLLIIIVYRGWFNLDIIAKGDWKAKSNNWIKDWLNIPYAWDTGDFGGISFLSAGRIVRYPLYFFQAFLNQVLKLPYVITERLIWFFPFLFISAVSIYALTQTIFKDKIAGFVAIFAFLFNNFVLFRAHGGQMMLLVAFGLTPVVILFFIKTLKEKFWQNILLTAVTLTILMYFDARLAVLVFSVLVAYGLYIICIKKFIKSHDYQNIKNQRIFQTILFVSLTLLVLNAFWLLPLILSKQEIGFVSEFSASLERIKSLSRTNFWHTLSLSIGDNPVFAGYVYFPNQINKALLFFMPLIVFLALFLSKRKKEVAFWFGLYLLFAFLAKGLNPPLSFLNEIFYATVPFSSMFRLPTKFMYVMATPFAMLYGLTCAEIIKKLTENGSSQIVSKNSRSRKIGQVFNKKNQGFIKILIIAIFIFIPLSVIYPAVFGPNKLANTIGGSSFNSYIPSEYFLIDDWLNNQEPHYKSIFLMGTPTYNFFSFSHPRFEIYTAVQSRSVFGNYYLDFLDTVEISPFLTGIHYLRDVNHFDKILSLVNVRYLILPSEDDPDWPWQSENTQLVNYKNILADNNNLNLKKVDLGEKINIFENPQALPKVLAPKKNMLVLGAGEALDYLLSRDDVLLQDWNFFFSETQATNFEKIKGSLDTILFFNQDIDDLLLNSIEPEYKIKKNISFNNYDLRLASSGALRLNYEPQLRDEINLAAKQIRFDKRVDSLGAYDIWARMAFLKPSQSSVEIVLDSQKNGVFHPEVRYAGQYKWSKLVTVNLNKGDHRFSLIFSGPDLALDEIVLIPSEKYLQKKEELANELANKNNIFISSLGIPELARGGEGFFEIWRKILEEGKVKFIEKNDILTIEEVRELGFYTENERKNFAKIIDPESGHLDFSGFSHFVVRIKENISQDLFLVIEDSQNRTCQFNVKSPISWEPYGFNLSECQLKTGLDLKQIKSVRYQPSPLSLDIYLMDEQGLEEVKSFKAKDVWIRDFRGREYRKDWSDIVISEIVENKIFIGEDAFYQLIFEARPKTSEAIMNQILIDQKKLSLTRTGQGARVSEPIFLKKAVYELDKKTCISLKRVVYYKGKEGLKGSGENPFEAKEKAMDIISWQMLNPSKYLIKAKVHKPSFVNLLDGYDSGWVARYEDKKSHSVLVTSINNSFLIEPDALGEEMDIYLEYEPQKYMNIGFIIFLSGWTLIIGNLIFLFFRNRKKNNLIVAFIGPDGSGKSTYINFMADELQKKSIDFVIYYPFNYFLLRKTLDVFKKKGKRRKQKKGRALFKFWPLIALGDNWTDYLFRIRRENKIVFCDRYFYDLATSFVEFGFSFDWLYKIYLKLIPKPDLCLVCDAKEDILKQREKDGSHTIDFHCRQRKRYLDIAKQFSFFIIDSNKDIKSCQKKILNILEINISEIKQKASLKNQARA